MEKTEKIILLFILWVGRSAGVSLHELQLSIIVVVVVSVGGDGGGAVIIMQLDICNRFYLYLYLCL